MTITISISDEAAKVLQSRAENMGITIEELARIELEKVADLIGPDDDEFKCAAEYVLKKNAELYRRLAEGPKS